MANVKTGLSGVVTAAMTAAFVALSGGARAEVSEVRFMQQTSIAYLQLNVLKHEKLLEKHGKALGLPDLKVSWVTTSGTTVINDALISGAVDFVAGGTPGMITLWARTAGTPQEIRGVATLAESPLLMNTNNPNLRSIKDLTSTNKITLTAVKVSIQAIVLQMAAEQAFGAGQYARLDPLTMTLSPPDATTGLLSGAGGFDVNFSTPPYQEIQLKNPKIRTILNSEDVIGRVAVTGLSTSKRFHDANPTVYRAVVNALDEASSFIEGNKRKAAEYFVADARSSMSAEDVTEIISGPGYKFTIVPNGIMKFADFMHRVGTLNRKPEKWSDVFFPEIATLAGN